MKEQEKFQTTRGFQKLFAKPLKIEIFMDYEKKDDDWVPIKEEPIVAWLHPLTGEEWADCEAVGIEAFRHFDDKGAGEEDCIWRANREQECYQLMLSIRVSEKEKAETLFKNIIETFQINQIEAKRLIREYNKAFVPDREERKNCLRERLGQGSETPSTSPAISEIQD